MFFKICYAIAAYCTYIGIVLRAIRDGNERLCLIIHAIIFAIGSLILLIFYGNWG